MRIYHVLIAILLLFVVGCTPQQPQQPTVSETTPTVENNILSEGASPVLDFNKADYDEALNSDKLVVLYFYAKWCPLCQAEVPKFYEAMQEIDSEEVIGFRVNFKDDDTDDNETALAREFGVAYQHTKVFLLNGERVLKAPDSWDKDRYITEINTYINQ